jgi:hypothetical protein
VKLAARGQRDMDAGPQVIADSADLAQVRRQAFAVYVKSVVAAAAFNLLAFLI